MVKEGGLQTGSPNGSGAKEVVIEAAHGRLRHDLNAQSGSRLSGVGLRPNAHGGGSLMAFKG